MKNDIETRIIAAQPHGRGSKEFIARTLEAIKQAEGRETFGEFLRTTKVNQKENLFMKLKHLPTAAIVAITIGALLVVSGTAYAAYKLWLSPEAHVKSVEEKYGRNQALIDLRNCNQQDEQVTVEINQNKPGNPDEAAKSLVAHCEIQAIQNWAISGLGEDPSSVLSPFTIDSISGQQVNLSNQYQDTRTFNLADDIPVVFKGNIIKPSTLRKGDAVAFVVTGSKQELRALVKLSLPITYYDSPDLQNTYHTRHECYGNPKSSCIDLPSLDVLRDGEGGANPDTSGESRLIQGKLVSFNGREFKLESTSGDIYTIHTASDVIGVFNAENPYGAITIEVGDVLEVRYSQPINDNPKEIKSSQYHSIQLLLQEYDKKTDKNFQKYRFEP